MKTMFCSAVRALLLAASFTTFACASASLDDGADADAGLGSAEQALLSKDADFDPPELDKAPPPPPPPPSTTCTNVTNDGVCQRYCCTETTTYKRCGVLPCPTTTGTTGTIGTIGTVKGTFMAP